MPIGTCDPATRSQLFNEQQLERHAPDNSGSVLVDVHYGWDGTSTKESAGGTGCDGPVWYLRVRNTSAMTAWAVLPNKKQGNTWIQGGPGVDQIIGSPTVASRTGGVATQLANLGLSNWKDVLGTTITFTQPG